MDIDAIKKFMDLIEERGIKKIRIKDEKEGFEIEVDTRNEPPGGHPAVHHPAPPPSTPAPAPAPEAKPQDEQKPASSEPKKEEGNFVFSPMVGTFYASAAPEEPPFIKEGDEVKEDTVVGIIEAMKVMNEVKAGMKGKVGKILVSNGEVIEYGTKLVEIV